MLTCYVLKADIIWLNYTNFILKAHVKKQLQSGFCLTTHAVPNHSLPTSPANLTNPPEFISALISLETPFLLPAPSLPVDHHEVACAWESPALPLPPPLSKQRNSWFSKELWPSPHITSFELCSFNFLLVSLIILVSPLVGPHHCICLHRKLLLQPRMKRCTCLYMSQLRNGRKWGRKKWDSESRRNLP